MSVTSRVPLRLKHEARADLVTMVTLLLAGSAASAVWLPALWLSASLVPLAVHAMLFSAVPLALIPLLLWGAFYASWSTRSNVARAIGTTHTITQPRADVLVVVEDVVGVVHGLHV